MLREPAIILADKLREAGREEIKRNFPAQSLRFFRCISDNPEDAVGAEAEEIREQRIAGGNGVEPGSGSRRACRHGRYVPIDGAVLQGLRHLIEIKAYRFGRASTVNAEARQGFVQAIGGQGKRILSRKTPVKA